jgi:hypothetical protein
MAIDLFGYNGVLELEERVVNEVLATYLYERHLVFLNGQITDGDFIAVKAPIPSGEIHLYLELARPFLHIQTSDGTNVVTLHVPFSRIGAFLVQNGSLANQSVPNLALVLFDVPVQKSNTGLLIDFSKITGDDVGIAAIGLQTGPTGVGGRETLEVLLDDATIENQLKDKNGQKTVVAKDLRQQLADSIKNGAIGPTSVPVSLGGIDSALKSWDLLLFGNANDRDPTDVPADAGADLLLFEDANVGRGERTDAGQTLPPAPETPEYGWTLSLRASVLLDDINRALDRGPYYVQGETLNTPETPDNPYGPYGFLVVPSGGSRAYALPTGNGKVTVGASQNGQAQLTIADGGLTPNGRARARNLDRNVEASFTADGSGAAKLSIRADAGERLAVTIDAISLSSDSSTVIWRPAISFGDGQITAAFHYYHYIPHWCDAEGDATVSLQLFADRGKAFSIGAKVLDANASAPWWAYVVAWLGPGLIGQDIFAPILVGLVPTIIHSLAGSFIGDNAGALGSALTDKISAPSIENLAMLLDQVDVYNTGLQLSGRADSGSILAYDRTVAFSTQPGVVLNSSQPSPVYMRFDWAPSITSINITSSSRCAVITDQPHETFWSASYDDLPADSSFRRDPFTMFAGDSLMVWVEIAGGHAKVLFERPPGGDAPSTGISITWIALRDRVNRAVKLVNGIKATVVGSLESLTLEETLYRYDGSISLTTTKFFLTSETQELGQELWYWDDQQVTDLGITLPGGSVTLDATNRQLIVHLDQSGLDAQSIAATHWVRFHGTDVFGVTLETKILVQTFPVTLRPRPIATNPPLGPVFVHPLSDPTRDKPVFDFSQLASEITNLLAPQVGAIEASVLSRSLSEALTTGLGSLDVGAATALLTLLADRFSGIHSK